MIALPRLRPTAAAAMALALGLPGGAGAQAFDTSYTVGASSSWVVRGIPLSRTDTPVAFASADLYAAAGWSIGGLVGHFDTVYGESATPVNLRAGYEWSFGGRWTLMGQWRYLDYPGADSLNQWCYHELAASLADADRWVLSWSAETRHGPGCNEHGTPVINSRSLELNAQWPLAHGLSLSGGVARRMYGAGQGYLYGQAGAGWRHGGLRVLLDRVWVSPQAQLIYGPWVHDRWVGSVVWAF